MNKYIYSLLFLVLIFSCKKEKKNNTTTETPSPMAEKNGWELIKHSADFNVYSNGVNTLNLVKEHASGIDILYSSIFQLQSELRYYNIRWRAFNDQEHKVQKMIVNEITNKDPVGRPILSGLVNAYSQGMGDNDLYAITQHDIRGNTYIDPPLNRFDFFNVKTTKTNINSFRMEFKNTQSSKSVANANPTNAFVCNGMNARIFSKTNNIYATGEYIEIIGAAPKGDQLVMLAVKDSFLYVLESHQNVYTHNSGSYSEMVNAAVIKNVYQINQITSTVKENYIDVSKYFYDNNNLYVFLGLRNQKHRMLKIDLSNYVLSSEKESLYEQINLLDYKDVLLMEDRPGDLLSLEKDGIYLIANNTKTFIQTPMIKQGTVVTNWYYTNGKIWQILFDETGSYLINKKL